MDKKKIKMYAIVGVVALVVLLVVVEKMGVFSVSSYLPL